MKLKPAPNQILLQPPTLNTEIIKGGLVIPESQDKNTKQLKVIAIGNKVDKRLELEIGDNVIIVGGTPITVNDILYIIVSEQQIIVVIK